MIISASRRTDIPAFYAEWFMNRIRAGYCTVPNPFNSKQVSRVSLAQKDVDVIVFWTRNAKPLLPYLQELDERGYRYYVQYTLMNNPRSIDVKSPAMPAALDSFRALAEHVGPERVIWRYDPIVFSQVTGVQFHIDTFGHIAETLNGYAQRCVISIMDMYAKINKRMRELVDQGVEVIEYKGKASPRFDLLMNTLVDLATANGMEITSCAEPLGLVRYGIKPGKCVDDDYIKRVFGIDVTAKKDPSQRKVCGCVQSRDIGMYDTCLFECAYCYATRSFELARKNHSLHDPLSPSLVGWYDKEADESAQIKLEL